MTEEPQRDRVDVSSKELIWEDPGAWVKGRVAYGSTEMQPVAASGAWVAEDTFVAKLCLYETPGQTQPPTCWCSLDFLEAEPRS